MSGFISFATGGGGQARNPQLTYEPLTAAGGLSITNSNGTHAISAYSALSTPSNNLCGIIVTAFNASSSVGRFALNIRAGGSTIIVPDYYFKQHTNAFSSVFIPLSIAASTSLDMAIRASNNGTSLVFSVEGVIANATDAPGFATMTALNFDATSTQAGGAVDVPNTDTWTELIASLGADYDAIMVTVGDDAVAPGAVQVGTLYLGTGAASSEVAFFQASFLIYTAHPYIALVNLPPIFKTLASGTRISAKIHVPTPNSDNYHVGLWGLS